MREFRFRSRSRHDLRSENREELAAWLDERIEELIALGNDRHDARRLAIEEFGNVPAALEYADRQDAAADRRMGFLQWGEELLSDLRIAARTLSRTPAVTGVVLLTLAVGVGAPTAVYSVAHALLIRSLPYGGENSLAYLAAIDDGVVTPGLSGGRHSAMALVALRERTTSFAGIAGVTIGNGVLRGVGDPEQVFMANVTPDAFEVLQARAAIGRTFVAADAERNVVILLDGIWRRRFNADPSVVGRTIDYGGAQREVIGVMPAGFRVPTYETAELVTPQKLTNILRGEHARHVRFLRLFARVRPETEAKAQADLDRVMTAIRAEFPRDFDRVGARVVPIRKAVSGDAWARLLVLMGAAAFVLLISCANIAGVLLSRGLARRGELAIRVALGAGRRRLVRQFLAEGLVLASLGAGLGLAIAQIGIVFLRQFSATTLPAGTEFSLELRVVWFGIGVASVTAFVATLLPALTVTRRIAGALRREGGRITPSRATRMTRLGLVGAQLTIAVVLLIGAGLMLQTMRRLAVLDLGYATTYALTFRPQFVAPKSDAEQDVFYGALYEQLRALPRVVAVGGGNVPTGGLSSVTSLLVEGAAESTQLSHVRYTPASDDYFAALGMTIVRGRVFGSGDHAGAPPVAVVSAGLAKQLWPGSNPLGARVRIGPDRPWSTIIGVVGDVRMGGGDVLQPSIYTSQRQDHWPGASAIVVRVAEDPGAIAADVRAVVQRVDPTVVIPNVRTLEDVRQSTPAIAERNVQMQLMLVFSVLAVAVSAIGVYGMGAYAAQARATEFGIRVALGASRASLLWLAVRDSAFVAAVGLATGIPLAWLLARRLRESLFEVQPFDVPSMAAASGVLAMVVVVASLVPARRASLVDPTRTIRAE